MVFLGFFFAAALTIYSATKLSENADVISEKSAFGGLLVGTILLAGATSLPEVTTSLAAVYIKNTDIAIGNVLGSNIFNVFILAAMDIFYRSKKLMIYADGSHRNSAIGGVLLTIVVLVGLLIEGNIAFLNVGASGWLILLLYTVIMIILSKNNSFTAEPQTNQFEVSIENKHLIKAAFTKFGFFALVILGAGSMLSVTGDKIALITGMSSTFVGSFLIAATTSLPEAVSVFAAMRLGNINLALGTILGSNLFNMLIVSVADVAYQDGNILASVTRDHIYTASGGLVMSLLIFAALYLRPAKFSLVYILPSCFIVIVYFVITYILFAL